MKPIYRRLLLSLACADFLIMGKNWVLVWNRIFLKESLQIQQTAEHIFQKLSFSFLAAGCECLVQWSRYWQSRLLLLCPARHAWWTCPGFLNIFFFKCLEDLPRFLNRQTESLILCIDFDPTFD